MNPAPPVMRNRKAFAFRGVRTLYPRAQWSSPWRVRWHTPGRRTMRSPETGPFSIFDYAPNVGVQRTPRPTPRPCGASRPRMMRSRSASVRSNVKRSSISSRPRRRAAGRGRREAAGDRRVEVRDLADQRESSARAVRRAGQPGRHAAGGRRSRRARADRLGGRGDVRVDNFAKRPIGAHAAMIEPDRPLCELDPVRRVADDDDRAVAARELFHAAEAAPLGTHGRQRPGPRLRAGPTGRPLSRSQTPAVRSSPSRTRRPARRRTPRALPTR